MFKSDGISRVVRFVLLGAVVLTVSAGFARHTGVVEAQTQSVPPYTPPIYGGAGDLLDEAHRMQQPKQDRVKGLDNERQKQLKADVNKLLTLSTELKADVDKTHEDQLSVEAMRKAAEIEKLAKSIQSRMKN